MRSKLLPAWPKPLPIFWRLSFPRRLWLRTPESVGHSLRPCMCHGSEPGLVEGGSNVRNGCACAVDQVDEKFVRLCFPNNAVNIDFHHDVFLQRNIPLQTSVQTSEEQHAATVPPKYESHWTAKFSGIRTTYTDWDLTCP